MLRNQIRDAALSVAKSYGHDRVEQRHVLYAVARLFRDDPSLSGNLNRWKARLEPRGTAIETPEFTAEAAALVKGIRSREDAADTLRKEGGASGDSASGAAVSSRQEELATAAEPSSAENLAVPSGESVTEVLGELDALIGLDSVKSQVRHVIAVVQANTERARAGLKQVNPSLHLVFTGPPGTGKTTVARLVARLYAASGAIRGAGFTEASRSDLVAGYVGQTALKTKELIDRTRPGVLFIDEAYALTPKADADYGHEAISTLVKAMEDHRDDLAIIVAGYEEEMAAFVGSNPGLRSRLNTFISFPDYSAAELCQIFELMVGEAAIGLDDAVREKATEIFQRASGADAFGNARFARSLFENAYARMAARAAEDGVITVDELEALTVEDLQIDLEGVIRRQRRIGFVTGEG